MNKKILYTQNDGSVAVVSIAPGVSIDVVVQTLPTTQYIIVDEAQMPSADDQKYFIAALKIDGSNVAVDLNRAREVTKQTLRRVRQPLFDKNDLALRDAMISGDQTAVQVCVSERDRLRNLPNLADQSQSVSELKQLIEDNHA